jgi:hypothetical protein
MDEAAEAFMDTWLDANVTHKHANKPSSSAIKALARRNISDAAAAEGRRSSAILKRRFRTNSISSRR